METQYVVTSLAEVSDNAVFDLALWVGRHQAFGLIASKCAAADAHSLREIRDRRLYRSLGLDWKEFCTLHAGICYKTADNIISRLAEFGETYFNLSQIVAIQPADYRTIAPAIENNAVEFEGTSIPIDREHTEALLEAVRSLRKQADKAQRDASPVASVDGRLDQIFGRIDGMLRRGLSEDDRASLLMCLDNFIFRARMSRDNLVSGERRESTPQS